MVMDLHYQELYIISLSLDLSFKSPAVHESILSTLKFPDFNSSKIVEIENEAMLLEG